MSDGSVCQSLQGKTVTQAEVLAVLRQARERWAQLGDTSAIGAVPSDTVRWVTYRLDLAAQMALLEADSENWHELPDETRHAAGLALFDRTIQRLEAGDER